MYSSPSTSIQQTPKKKSFLGRSFDRVFKKTDPSSNHFENQDIATVSVKVTNDRVNNHDNITPEAQLFNKRKAVINGTWKAVEDSLGEESTRLFYKRLFEKYPEVLPLFGRADMDAQAEKLRKTIGLSVRYLDNVDELVPIIQDLGKRHAKIYKVKREQYEYVQETLMWTLETGLGDAWTEDVAEAWNWVMTLIGTTMADAGDNALEEEE